jgi:hypothetical protein
VAVRGPSDYIESVASVVDDLARTLVLGALLDELSRRFGAYEVVAHWTQGEFHHDVVLRLPEEAHASTGRFLVVATNCNGGVKEVLAFDTIPSQGALWRSRCPGAPEFAGELPPILARAITEHWFDPCELLAPDARSELRPEHRARQPGGGWCMRQ